MTNKNKIEGKWYNIELTEKEGLREYLKENNIKFEISKAYNLYHFEIFLDSINFIKVCNFLTGDY